MKEYTQVLNIRVRNIRMEELLVAYKEGALFTPNADHIVRLQTQEEFYRAYRQAEWVVCDSRVLRFFSPLSGRRIRTVVPGSTFFHEFCDYHCEDPECRIFLLGSKEGGAEKAKEKINQRVGREMVVGVHSPSFSFVDDEKECEEICGLINQSGATVLLVGVSSPKQEMWIMRYRDRLPGVRMQMALGATIDFEAGWPRRSPLWIQKMGLEWLWRFCHEPKRLFKRYFMQDPKIFWYFLKQLFGKYRNPFG